MKTSVPRPNGKPGSPPARPPRKGLSMDLLEMLDTLDEEDRALLLLKYAEAL